MPTFSHLVALQLPRFPSPSWSEIEAAVRALNGADRPLFTLAPADRPNEGAGCLTVQGGAGAYTLTAYFPGRGSFRYYDPRRSATKEVAIYHHGDLQDSVSERYVCEDFRRVMWVVWHFWDRGELCPGMRWERV